MSDNITDAYSQFLMDKVLPRLEKQHGYDVNHASGEGGHNQKHASQIFPDVMRCVWRDWQTDKVEGELEGRFDVGTV